MNVQHIAIFLMFAVAIAYFVFLYASWQQFQNDREIRDTKIDELLSRIPKPKPKAE